jgi:chaperonin GroES
MELRPLDDRVVIKPSEAQEKTAGGIFLPDAAKEKPMIGKVLWVGPGKIQDDGKRAPMSVKKDDEVIYGKYMGNEIEMDSQKYVIVKEGDLLGIVEK